MRCKWCAGVCVFVGWRAQPAAAVAAACCPGAACCCCLPPHVYMACWCCRVTGRGHIDINRISGYLPGKIVFFLMQVGVWWVAGRGGGWGGGWQHGVAGGRHRRGWEGRGQGGGMAGPGGRTEERRQDEVGRVREPPCLQQQGHTCFEARVACSSRREGLGGAWTQGCVGIRCEGGCTRITRGAGVSGRLGAGSGQVHTQVVMLSQGCARG